VPIRHGVHIVGLPENPVSRETCRFTLSVTVLAMLVFSAACRSIGDTSGASRSKGIRACADRLARDIVADQGRKTDRVRNGAARLVRLLEQYHEKPGSVKGVRVLGQVEARDRIKIHLARLAEHHEQLCADEADAVEVLVPRKPDTRDRPLDHPHMFLWIDGVIFKKRPSMSGAAPHSKRICSYLLDGSGGILYESFPSHR